MAVGQVDLTERCLTDTAGDAGWLGSGWWWRRNFQEGRRAIAITDWPNGGVTKRSAKRVIGATVES
ncbi:hypothetical protein GCM10009827_050600 [Dactylosporangium maewongense]|uniref:Uncharacterized protein n=1 Tax=Dactylosporangium maewongense TaxID=634393 RepID=A0ABN2AUX4_9ACTN